ncbi:MAG: hypothetical protein ACERKV_11830 [Clostridiaceae bacterium]
MDILNKIKKPIFINSYSYIPKGENTTIDDFIINKEQQILKSIKSCVPLFCLNNISISYEDIIIKYDFILITTKFIKILDSKSLLQDMKITANGDFLKLPNNVVEISPIEKNNYKSVVLRKILINNNLLNSNIINSNIISSKEKNLELTNSPISIARNIIDIESIPEVIRDDLENYKNSKGVSLKNMRKIGSLFIEINKSSNIDEIASTKTI